jgi:hypothetical protein
VELSGMQEIQKPEVSAGVQLEATVGQAQTGQAQAIPSSKTKKPRKVMKKPGKIWKADKAWE